MPYNSYAIPSMDFIISLATLKAGCGNNDIIESTIHLT